MILSFFTQKSTRSAKLSSVFAERFSGEGQSDFAINKTHKVSLKDRNNLYISCIFNGFKFIIIIKVFILFLALYRMLRCCLRRLNFHCMRMAPLTTEQISCLGWFLLRARIHTIASRVLGSSQQIGKTLQNTSAYTSRDPKVDFRRVNLYVFLYEHANQQICPCGTLCSTHVNLFKFDGHAYGIIRILVISRLLVKLSTLIHV